jgi:hypothetical protein
VTSTLEAREVLYQAFFTGWGAETPIVFENELARESLNQGGDPWVFLHVHQATSEQDSLGETGNRRFMRRARVRVEIRTPTEGGHAKTKSGGMRTGDELAEIARSIFEGVNFTGVWCDRGVQIVESGIDGKWYLHVVEALLSYEEIK